MENLNRAERLGIIRDTQEWLGARGLRNRLVHEYIDDLDALAASRCRQTENLGDVRLGRTSMPPHRDGNSDAVGYEDASRGA